MESGSANPLYRSRVDGDAHHEHGSGGGGGRAKLVVDHVTFAGPNLAADERMFAAIGLPTTFGGTHSNGATRMSLVSFDDGSYIELISTVEPGGDSPWWHEAIHSHAGPCAWAIRTGNTRVDSSTNISTDTRDSSNPAVDDGGDGLSLIRDRARKAGVATRGPMAMSRARPDGRELQWELLYLGDGQPGSSLPFAIADRTPRSWRVQPTSALAGESGQAGGVCGVTKVVQLVDQLEPAAGMATAVLDVPRAKVSVDEGFGARLATFGDEPLVLAEPIDRRGSLAARLRKFGPSPCAFMLGVDDLDAAVVRRPAGSEFRFVGCRAAWLEMGGGRQWLGLMERSPVG